jgi:hypothetical protein
MRYIPEEYISPALTGGCIDLDSYQSWIDFLNGFYYGPVLSNNVENFGFRRKPIARQVVIFVIIDQVVEGATEKMSVYRAASDYGSCINQQEQDRIPLLHGA